MPLMIRAAVRSSTGRLRPRAASRIAMGALSAAISLVALTGCIAAPLLGNFMFDRFERVPPREARPSPTESAPTTAPTPEPTPPGSATPDPAAPEPPPTAPDTTEPVDTSPDGSAWE